jgi:hypothetical protein
MSAIAAPRMLLLALGLTALAAPAAAEVPVALVADALATRIVHALPGGGDARIAAAGPARATLRARLVDLLAENAIGPASRAAAAGLVPLRADERVAARMRLFSLIPPVT